MKPHKGYIKDDLNFKHLFENTVMLLGHLFETAYLFTKLTKEEFTIFEFINDPTCGLVSKNNDWCLVGGDVLILKTWVDNTLRVISDLKNIYELKAGNDYTAQILIDPWSEHASIWQIEIDLSRLTRPVSLMRVKEFRDYRNKPYSEKVDW